MKSLTRGLSIFLAAGLLGVLGCGEEPGASGPPGTVPADAPKSSLEAYKKAPPQQTTPIGKSGAAHKPGGNLPPPPAQPR